ncbi:MAG: aminotransferase class I/II-fold pyridoxal phosphate-dependent enzyme, partial [Micromonosporaceae bacterium]
LRAGARAVIVTSRAQNPTGAAVSEGRAARLREVLAAYPEALLIEDDHSAELSEVALAPLAGVTPRWAFVRSTSKPYGPDLRLAVLTGDAATVDRVAGRMRMGAGWVSTVLQQLVVALWSDETVGHGVARAREAYRERREGLLAALASRGVPAVGRTGINVWIPVADETAVVTRLRDAGWAVSPGAVFRLATPPGVRVTVSALDTADLPALADAVAAAVRPAPSHHGA